MTNLNPTTVSAPATGNAPVLFDYSAAYLGPLNDALGKLLPLGPVWNWPAGGIGQRVLTAAAAMFADSFAETDLFLREIDPAQTHELLSEFEAALGLPDPCLQASTQSEAQRRAAIAAKLVARPTFTDARVVALALSIGYSVAIVKLVPFAVDTGGAGDLLWLPEARFALVLFGAMSGFDLPADLRCAIESEIQAHLAVYGWNGTFHLATITAPNTAPAVFSVG